MEMIRVSKQFSFDMAHALFGYDGPCRNIHGHTYHLTVTIKGAIIEDKSDPKLGMVLDFTELKKVVQEQIISVYDHVLVLNGEAEQHIALKEKAEADFGRIILLHKQPTCENLLLHYRDLIQPFFSSPTKQLVYMRLQETPNSYAEWNINDN